MKRVLSLLLCITMLLSSINVVRADENTDNAYNTVNVEFSDNIGNLEKIQIMVKDNNVYASAEELGTRLGYDVKVLEEYVAIYNEEDDENIPYGLTVFYYESTKVGHMLFAQMVDTYEAPFITIKNENGVWIPLEYSLLLLNSSMIIVDNTILIDMPSKNIIDIYMEVLKKNQTYLFDWQDDVGLSEENEDTMGKASFVVDMFSGLLDMDGDSWVQFVQNFALDSSVYDSKYGEKLAMLFCTYSDVELKQEVKEIKQLMSHFNGKGVLGKSINAINKELDKNIGDLLKTSNGLKSKISVNNNANFVAYNKSYQALENACDKADFFSNATELYTKVGKEVSEATSFLDKFYKVAEVVGFASEFQNQDKFAVNSLSEFVEKSDSQSIMSNAMKEGIRNYTGILHTNIAVYSVLRYLKENYDDLIFEATDLISSLGVSAQLMLIAWNVMDDNVPFYKEGLSNTDSFMLSMYASIFQADAFTSYQALRNSTFNNVSNITSENLYEVSEYCYTYLKCCYITRNAALGSLTEETKGEITSVIEYQNNINEEIAGLLVQLKNIDTTNEYGCYGFLPEDNEKYLKNYNNTAILENVKNMNSVENDIKIYKDILDMYYYKIDTGWEETENVSYLFFEGYSDIKTLSDAGYALIDLDNNGILELVVSSIDAAEDGVIYDLYTCVNGKVVYLASSGERYVYYLCDDNTIYFEGSSGALLTSWEKYVVNDNKESLSLLEMVVYDGYANEKNPWYYGNADCYDEKCGYDINRMTNINETEAESIIGKYRNQVVSIQLNSFEMYSPQ